MLVKIRTGSHERKQPSAMLWAVRLEPKFPYAFWIEIANEKINQIKEINTGTTPFFRPLRIKVASSQRLRMSPLVFSSTFNFRLSLNKATPSSFSPSMLGIIRLVSSMGPHKLSPLLHKPWTFYIHRFMTLDIYTSSPWSASIGTADQEPVCRRAQERVRIS